MSKLRSVFSSLLGNGSEEPPHPRESRDNRASQASLPEKYVYTRPSFLQLPTDNIVDHNMRPIFVSSGSLPFNAGYAECINGGKSKVNEDQAAVGSFHLCIGDNTSQAQRIPVSYYGVFDGHGGPGAAMMAAEVLIVHIQEKLTDIINDLHRILKGDRDETYFQEVTVDDLVFGALEAAFCSLDEQILTELSTFNISGGCAALVVLVLLEKVFVASTGDCRAVICLGDELKQLSKESTPWNELHRLQLVANSDMYSSIFQKDVTDTIFIRRVLHRDVGKKILCKEPTKSHWAYKVVTEEDVLFPFIYGKGKLCRLMETIGVSRSIGDHNLTTTFSRDYKLKPFLIPNPEVDVFNLQKTSATRDDFIIVGCDGLWDVLSNEKARDIARNIISNSSDENRYTEAAQMLIHQARGNNSGSGWKLENGQPGSFDDISVFVIPLEPMTHCTHTPVEK
ncbi:protein phosphatase 1H-like [Gigantopelta aegis]|uniref:protein phosphatase 1H-like n=1 Tax=Gigantopelta aegis TaxID=1735272 RepID=UPI001B88BC38|nr:protein phosphatase 1H-like [Gigantopelta aegis]